MSTIFSLASLVDSSTSAVFYSTRPYINSTFDFSSITDLPLCAAFCAPHTNTRTDLQFELFLLAQVSCQGFEHGTRAHQQGINAAIRYAHDNVVYHKFLKSDRSSLRILVYNDAAFANSLDLPSQLGRTIIITDKNYTAISVSFNSFKLRIVTRSVLSAEVNAFEVLSRRSIRAAFPKLSIF